MKAPEENPVGGGVEQDGQGASKSVAWTFSPPLTGGEFQPQLRKTPGARLMASGEEDYGGAFFDFSICISLVRFTSLKRAKATVGGFHSDLPADYVYM